MDLLLIGILVAVVELAAWRGCADSRDGNDWATHPPLWS